MLCLFQSAWVSGLLASFGFKLRLRVGALGPGRCRVKILGAYHKPPKVRRALEVPPSF